MKLKIFIIFLFCFKLSASVFEINAQSEIVITDSTAMTKNSALELQKYLKNILDETLNISNKSDSDKLSIILTKKDSKFAAKLPFYKKLSLLKDDSFIIKSEGENIIIAGTNHRALFYGVYHFLEYYLGCKFLTKDFKIIPKNSSFSLDPIYDVQVPDFLYREYFSKESDDIVFSTKLRLNGRLGHRSIVNEESSSFPKGRVIYNQFVPSQLIEDSKYTCNGQYDYSKDKVMKIAINSVNQKVSKMSLQKDDFILLEHEDRDSYCSKGIKEGEISGSAFLKYSKYIAKNLSNRDINVLYQAYQWSRMPPKRVKKLPENMTIFYSPIEADFSKPLSSKKNQDFLDDLKGWDRFGNDILIWHYVTNFGGYFQPYPNIYTLDVDIKLFKSFNHITGVFLQSSYETFAGELADLRTWVFSKLLWDSSSDIDLLIKEFCDAYYGEASQEVQKYIKTLNKVHRKTNEKLLVKNSINSKYLNLNSIRNLENILETGAKKVSNNSPYKRHLLKVFSGIDYVRVMQANDSKNLQKSKNRFKKFLASTDGIEYFSEGGKIENIKEIMEIERKTPILPKEARGLKEGVDWFDFQEYTLKLCCTDLVSDKNSSDGISAVMDGSLGDWGFQLDILNFPKGKWDIYANVKVEFNRDKGLIDGGNIAFYFGVHPTFIKGARFFAQCKDGVYQSVKIGTIDTSSTDAKTIWLSPSENSKVDKLYVDRIYIVREKTK